MSKEGEANLIHRAGEREIREIEGEPAVQTGVSLDTFAGKVQVTWAPEASVSTLGQMAFFMSCIIRANCGDPFRTLLTSSLAADTRSSLDRRNTSARHVPSPRLRRTTSSRED